MCQTWNFDYQFRCNSKSHLCPDNILLYLRILQFLLLDLKRYQEQLMKNFKYYEQQ